MSSPTMQTPGSPVTGSPGQSDGWLHGPVIDLAIGCGGAYIWIILLYAINAPAMHAIQPSYFVALLMLAISMPHYGGTLLRVYEQRSERRKYFVFSVVFTVLILGLFVLGLHNALAGSLLFTLYLTWSPWHYTGQSYGLAVMFLRRRGVVFDDLTKRLLYFSFFLSFALTFLLWHVASDGMPRAEAGDTIRFMPIGVPSAAGRILVPLVGLTYLVTLLVAATRLLKSATLKDLVPVALLVATQALWFAVPFFVAQMNVSTGVAPIDQYFDLRIFTIWTVMAHAAQYLWVTSFYAKASPLWRGPVHYYWKAAACGVAIWTLPAMLFSSDALGTYSYNGGLALMIAAAVNLHHFVLDGAIWKLRNSKIAGVLIRTVPEENATRLDEEARANPFGRRLAWAAMSLVMLSAYFVFWQQSFTLRDAFSEGAYERYEAGLDRLVWLGRDSSGKRMQLGSAYTHQAKYDDAERQYRRALEIQTSLDAFNGLMALNWERGDFAAVVQACEEAIGAYPKQSDILVTQGAAWLKLKNPTEARRSLERALAITPDSPNAREGMMRLEGLEQGGDESAARSDTGSQGILSTATPQA
ncbi:MAG: tetratricopeptide (TPR) repeat protein [Myxococcota bacterium]|jgi:tetratricopeptide (TPR) repeat protein